MSTKKSHEAFRITVGNATIKVMVNYDTRSFDLYNKEGNDKFVFINEKYSKQDYLLDVLSAMKKAVELGTKKLIKHNKSIPF